MKNILEYLEQSANDFPDKLAFTDENFKITYKDFSKKSKAIGSYLLGLQAKSAPIAVYMDKSIRNLLAFIGVVYSGNFYVVIDSQMPVERINTIFKALSPIAVITDQKYAEKAKLLEFDGQTLLFEDAVNSAVDEDKLKVIRAKSIDTDPLYALFTSGSTGVPKGTVICHKSVIAYAQWVKEAFNIDETTVFGNQAPFYFSMSVLDIFSTISNAATMHIIPKKLFSFPIKLLEYINERKINTIYWVPSALCIIANWKALDYVQLETVKKVLFAGEVMPTKQLNYWIQHMPDILFANLYGPTEVTDICTYYIVNRKFLDDEPLPIGNACNNCDVLVINSEGKEAKPGEEGELCVRGSFLALGYYNNPQKNTEAFIQNPINPYYPELVYKTGDIVKYNEFGELLYITRKDFQIKHMGYRIELGEIETAVSSLDKIAACACIYDKEKNKIVLIYQGNGIDENAIIDGIKYKLPKYMHPNKLVRVKLMPHNQNGKIDRVYIKNNYQILDK